MELAKRDDVPVELTWDLSLIYPTEEAMPVSYTHLTLPTICSV